MLRVPAVEPASVSSWGHTYRYKAGHSSPQALVSAAGCPTPAFACRADTRLPRSLLLEPGLRGGSSEGCFQREIGAFAHVCGDEKGFRFGSENVNTICYIVMFTMFLLVI